MHAPLALGQYYNCKAAPNYPCELRAVASASQSFVEIDRGLKNGVQNNIHYNIVVWGSLLRYQVRDDLGKYQQFGGRERD